MGINIGSAIGYLDLNTEGFSRGLTTSLSAIQGFNQGTNSLGNTMTTVGNGVEQLGKGMSLKLTAPLVAAGTAAVKTSADFESGMSNVKAISGATGSEMEQLKGKAMEMGAKTKFSASEAADAFSYMAMAGWKSADMMSGIEGIMDLAAASGEDLATTSDIVTDALTAFGMTAQDSGHFADILAAASSNANTNVSLLGESFKYCAPACGAMGYSAEDASIALGIMANSGIKGSQAGNTLKNAIVNMVKPTDAMAGVMKDLGLSLTDSEGNMLSLREVLAQLREKFSGLTEEEKASAAATLFGKESMSGMLAIINASDEDFNKLSGAIDNCDGSAKQMAETMMDNTSGSIEQMMGAIETLGIKIGGILSPIVRDIVDSISAFVDKLNGADEGTVRFAIAIAGVIASIGPLLIMIGKISVGVGSLINLFSLIGTAVAEAGGAVAVLTNPITLVIAAVAAFAAGLTYLYNTNENVRNALNTAWENISTAVSNAWSTIQPALQSLWDAFGNLVSALSPLIELIGGALVAAASSFIGILNGAFQALGPLISSVADIVNVVAETIAGLFDLITGDMDGAKEHFGNAIEAIKQFFMDGFTAIGEFISGFFDGFLGTIQTLLQSLGENVTLNFDSMVAAISEWASGIWDSITTWFSELGTLISDSVSGFVDSIVQFFTNLPENISTFLSSCIDSIIAWKDSLVSSATEAGSNFINTVIQFFSQLPYQIGYFIGYALGSIASWVIEMVNKATEMGTNFLNAVVQFFTQLPGKITEFVTNAWNNVCAWTSNMISKAQEMGTNFLNNVVNFFTQLPGKVLSFLTNVYNNAVSWASNMAAKASEAGTNFLNNVVNFFTQLPGKVAEFLNNAVNSAATFVSNMASKAKEAASQFTSNIVSGLQSIPSKVTSIGKNIVQGLWNGISGSIGWLKDKVASMASGILDGMKDALGIHSPSREAAKLGRYTMLGFGQGMEKEYDAMSNPLQEMMSDLLDVDQNKYQFESFMSVFEKVRNMSREIKDNFLSFLSTGDLGLALSAAGGNSVATNNVNAILNEKANENDTSKQNDKDDEPQAVKKEVNLNIQNFHNHRTEDIEEIANELKDYLDDTNI